MAREGREGVVVPTVVEVVAVVALGGLVALVAGWLLIAYGDALLNVGEEEDAVGQDRAGRTPREPTKEKAASREAARLMEDA